jgi:arabinogalactan endo-1,4-beta-galactosidase
MRPSRVQRWPTRLTVVVPLVTLVLTSLSASPALAGNGGSGGGSLRIRGADISFTLQEEAAGITYSDRGVTRPVENILARHGANYARLRVWTDPPAGYSDEASALTLARRAHRAGMKILLDLHYSDFWADPGKQTTPAAWQGQDLPTLTKTVHDYTKRIVAKFARQGTPVDMIQIGNEVVAGMLWPVGQIYQADGNHWTEFATLVNAGIAGAREANPRRHTMEVMVQIDRGGDNGGTQWFYDHIAEFGVQFDLIGLSYYPFWHGSFAALQFNLNDTATRYGKDIVVVETSYPWTLENGDTLANFISTPDLLPDGAAYPATPQGQAAYYERLREILAAVPGGHGAGFMAWEPEWLPGVGWAPGEGNPNDNLTMFDWTGAALPSLASFRGPRH